MTATTRRGLLAVGVLATLWAGGCGSNGFDLSSLDAAFRRSGRGACDGFVFVPTRQALEGETIPHATIQIIPVPIDQNWPVAEGQADANGFYRFENFQLDQPYMIVAEEPFTGGRRLLALISFAPQNEEQRKNLTDVTTVAARVYELAEAHWPLTLDQIAQLEQFSEEALEESENAGLVTTSLDALDSIANDVLASSFGNLRLTILSDPVATATVTLNGKLAGEVQTAFPAARSEAGVLDIDLLLVGQTQVSISAPGFLTDTFQVSIQANQTTQITRRLVPEPAPGEDRPPVIVDATAEPDPVAFQGGKVSLLAIVRDPESDALTVRATVVGPDGEETQLDLRRMGGDYFGADLTVPGNPKLFSQVYSVLIEAVDAPFVLPDDGGSTGPGRPAVFSLQFAVNGVEPPPSGP